MTNDKPSVDIRIDTPIGVDENIEKPKVSTKISFPTIINLEKDINKNLNIVNDIPHVSYNYNKSFISYIKNENPQGIILDEDIPNISINDNQPNIIDSNFVYATTIDIIVPEYGLNEFGVSELSLETSTIGSVSGTIEKPQTLLTKEKPRII